jgi:hypothetical protein
MHNIWDVIQQAAGGVRTGLSQQGTELHRFLVNISSVLLLKHSSRCTNCHIILINLQKCQFHQRFFFYVHVNLHRNKFLYNTTN